MTPRICASTEKLVQSSTNHPQLTIKLTARLKNNFCKTVCLHHFIPRMRKFSMAQTQSIRLKRWFNKWNTIEYTNAKCKLNSPYEHQLETNWRITSNNKKRDEENTGFWRQRNLGLVSGRHVKSFGKFPLDFCVSLYTTVIASGSFRSVPHSSSRNWIYPTAISCYSFSVNCI